MKIKYISKGAMILSIALLSAFYSCQSEDEIVAEPEVSIVEEEKPEEIKEEEIKEEEVKPEETKPEETKPEVSEVNDEDVGEYETCNPDGANASKFLDISNPVNEGKIDDRSCYANYKESVVNGKKWGVYNITHGSNNQDTNTLQPRIERSFNRSQTTGIGSLARFTGTVRILEVGDASGTSNDGTYIMQAKGKHTGGGGSQDPAICLYLAKPVYGTDSNGNRAQVSFNIYREQIKFRGGSGRVGRENIFLTNVKKNVETAIELEVGFRADPNDATKKIHYADAKIGGETFNWNIPEPEKGTQSGIRYGAYRVKGGRAQIRWANTTYRKVERR